MKKVSPQDERVRLNGFTLDNGNYIWGVALSLAFQALCQGILKQPLQVKSSNPKTKSVVRNFNEAPFTKQCLSEQFYLAKAGFGNQTIREINRQLRKRFPNKTTPQLGESLSENSFIAYAYLMKKMNFKHPFDHMDELLFESKTVKGFQATNQNQKEQVLIHKYDDQENFIISLVTTTEKEEIFFIKSQKTIEPEQAVDRIKQLDMKSSKKMSSEDEFHMPKISITAQRKIAELQGVSIKNKSLQNRPLGSVIQVIKLNIDEFGVKVENEALVAEQIYIPSIKRLYLDKPFWVVMRQSNQHPYLVAFIKEPNEDDSGEIQIPNRRSFCCPF